MCYHISELQKCRDFLLRLSRNLLSKITSDTHASLTEEEKQDCIDNIYLILEMLSLLKELELKRVDKT